MAYPHAPEMLPGQLLLQHFAFCTSADPGVQQYFCRMGFAESGDEAVYVCLAETKHT